MKYFTALLLIAFAMVPFSTASELEGTMSASARGETFNSAEIKIDQNDRRLGKGKVCES
jgi:hypothetical protein